MAEQETSTEEVVSGIVATVPVGWVLFYLWHLGPPFLAEDKSGVLDLTWYSCPYYFSIIIGSILLWSAITSLLTRISKHL